MVNAKWGNKKVTVEDASQYSGKRIHVVFEKGRVKELDPELNGRPVMSVQELLDRLRRGERLPL